MYINPNKINQYINDEQNRIKDAYEDYHKSVKLIIKEKQYEEEFILSEYINTLIEEDIKQGKGYMNNDGPLFDSFGLGAGILRKISKLSNDQFKLQNYLDKKKVTPYKLKISRLFENISQFVTVSFYTPGMITGDEKVGRLIKKTERVHFDKIPILLPGEKPRRMNISSFFTKNIATDLHYKGNWYFTGKRLLFEATSAKSNNFKGSDLKLPLLSFWLKVDWRELNQNFRFDELLCENMSLNYSIKHSWLKLGYYTTKQAIKPNMYPNDNQYRFHPWSIQVNRKSSILYSNILEKVMNNARPVSIIDLISMQLLRNWIQSENLEIIDGRMAYEHNTEPTYITLVWKRALEISKENRRVP